MMSSVAMSCVAGYRQIPYGVQKFRRCCRLPVLMGGNSRGRRTGGSVMASALYDRSDSILEPAVECMPRPVLDAYHDEKLAELSNLSYGRAPLITKLWDEAGVRPSDIHGRADFTAKVPFLTKD